MCQLYAWKRKLHNLRFEIFTQKYHTKSENILTSCDRIDLSLLAPYRRLLWKGISRGPTIKAISDMEPCHFYQNRNGRKIRENDSLAFDWTHGDILPQQIVDIVCASDDEEEKNDIENDDDLDDDNFGSK